MTELVPGAGAETEAGARARIANAADLALVMESAQLGFWTLNFERDVLVVNDHLAAMLGLSPSDLVSLANWSALVHPDDVESLRQVLRQRVGQRSRERFSIEYRMRHRDGRWVRVLSHGRVDSYSADGSARAIRGVLIDLTARHMAEDRLREREAELHQAHELIALATAAAALGWWRRDLVTGTLDCNERYAEMLGYVAEDFRSGRVRLEDLLRPEERESWLGAIAANLQPGADQTFSVEYELRHRDGHFVWVHDIGRITARGETGRPLARSGIRLDISERKRVEAETRARERLIAQSAALVAIGAWSIDMGAGTAEWTEAVRQVLDVGPDFMPDAGAIEHFMSGPTRQQWREACARALAGQGRFELELPMTTARGREVWVRWVGDRDIDRSDHRRLIGVMQDVTSRRAAVEREAQLNARLQLALEIGGIGIWEFDQHDRRSIWDATTYQLFGARSDDPRPPREILLQQLGETRYWEAVRYARELIDSGPVAELELTLGGDDVEAAARYLRMRARAELDRNSGRTRLIGVMLDETAQRRTQLELRRHREELQRLVREQTLEALAARDAALAAKSAQDELVTRVSHELRTPLHSLLGFLRLGRERLGADADAKLGSYLGRAEAAAQRLLAMVNELLDLARLESGHTVLQVQAQDLRPLLQSVGNELAPLYESKRIEFRCRVPPTPCIALVDADRIAQVLRNLVANALRFAPSSGCVEINLDATMLGSDPGWAIEVLDDGPGIEAHEVEAIFERFTMGTRQAGSGTGLGLAIAREISRRHGGDLRAGARTQGGARFELTLPAALGER
jgi:hypothetical protein